MVGKLSNMKRSFVLFLAVTLFSCNKNVNSVDKLNFKKWNVEHITVDGNEVYDELPWVEFFGCDIKENPCEGKWFFSWGVSRPFYWQVSDQGKQFEIQRMNFDFEQNDSVPLIDQQLYDLSGRYDIEQLDNKNLKLKSSSTIGYSGKTVEISMKKDE